MELVGQNGTVVKARYDAQVEPEDRSECYVVRSEAGEYTVSAEHRLTLRMMRKPTLTWRKQDARKWTLEATYWRMDNYELTQANESWRCTSDSEPQCGETQLNFSSDLTSSNTDSFADIERTAEAHLRKLHAADALLACGDLLEITAKQLHARWDSPEFRMETEPLLAAAIAPLPSALSSSEKFIDSSPLLSLTLLHRPARFVELEILGSTESDKRFALASGNQLTHNSKVIHRDLKLENILLACLAEGTEVARADGRSVPCEDVKPGDLLLGQHGVVTVEEVTRHEVPREEDVWTVEQQGGQQYTVSSEHRLTVQCTRNPTVRWSENSVSIRWYSADMHRHEKTWPVTIEEDDADASDYESEIPLVDTDTILIDRQLSAYPSARRIPLPQPPTTSFESADQSLAAVERALWDADQTMHHAFPTSSEIPRTPLRLIGSRSSILLRLRSYFCSLPRSAYLLRGEMTEVTPGEMKERWREMEMDGKSPAFAGVRSHVPKRAEIVPNLPAVAAAVPADAATVVYHALPDEDFTESSDVVQEQLQSLHAQLGIDSPVHLDVTSTVEAVLARTSSSIVAVGRTTQQQWMKHVHQLEMSGSASHVRSHWHHAVHRLRFDCCITHPSSVVYWRSHMISRSPLQTWSRPPSTLASLSPPCPPPPPPLPLRSP
jgi:hypothetical protein